MLQILPKFCPKKGPKVTGKRFAVVWQEADPALSPPGKVLAAKGAVELPHSGAQHLPSMFAPSVCCYQHLNSWQCAATLQFPSNYQIQHEGEDVVFKIQELTHSESILTTFEHLTLPKSLQEAVPLKGYLPAVRCGLSEENHQATQARKNFFLFPICFSITALEVSYQQKEKQQQKVLGMRFRYCLETGLHPQPGLVTSRESFS